MSGSSFENLRSKTQNPLTPWLLSDSLFQRVRAPSAEKTRHHECEVLPSDPEWDFVNAYFFQYASLVYSIKRVFCVHNPAQTEQFEASLINMDSQAQNPVFSPKWQEQDPTGCRAKVMARWREFAKAFSPVAVVRAGSRKDLLSRVSVFPYWHGSDQQKVQSICDSGFTYFGKHSYLQGSGDKGTSTDVGFFGSGIYFTNSARYATDSYSSGHLLLAWVSMRSPYPVIGEEEAPGSPLDAEKLQGGPAFENYDAHYIPVVTANPSDPMCKVYLPGRKDQIPTWDEVVVFHSNQTLPRFYVELTPTLPAPVPMPAPHPVLAPPPSTSLPSIFDIPPLLEQSLPNKEILETIGIRDESLAPPLNPLFRKFLAWRWVHGLCEWKIPCLEFDESSSTFLLEDGRMITGDSQSVRVWNPLSGECLRSFKKEQPHNKGKVLSLGKGRLLFPVDSRTLVIWNASADKVLQRFHYPRSVLEIDDFILLKNGYIAAIYDRKTVCLWNPLISKCQKTFCPWICRPQKGESRTADIRLFSMGKNYLAITCSAHSSIWGLNEEKCILAQLNVHFCPSHEEVVSSSSISHGLSVFNLSERDLKQLELRKLGSHEKEVLCCYRLKNGHVISGSEDKTLKIWDTQSCQCVKTLKTRAPVAKVWELKNGWIVCKGKDEILGVWDLQNGNLLQEFFASNVESVEEIGGGKILVVSKTNTSIFDLSRGVRSCTFPGKGRCLKEGFILCHSGYALQTIDPTSGHALQSFGASIVSSPTAPYQLPDGRKLIINDHSIFLEEKRGVFQCVVPNMDPRPLLFLKDGLVLVKNRENFQVVNPKTREVLNTFPSYRGAYYRKFISAPNGKLVALSDDQIDIWDRKCDWIIKSLPLENRLGPFWLSENVRFLARRFEDIFFTKKPGALKASFHYSGVIQLQNGGIVGVLEDLFLKIWDEKGKPLRILKGHETKISFAIEFHGNHLISGSKDGVLKIWDLQSGDVVCTLKDHKDEITAICELKDGLIASADWKGELKIWSSTGNLLYGLCLSSPASSILSLKDGRFVTISNDGKYRVWNLKDGKCEQEQEIETHLGCKNFYLAQREDSNLSIFIIEANQPCEHTIFDLRTGKALGRSLIAESFWMSKEKVVSFFDKRVFLWNVVSGKCVRQMQCPSDVTDCILLQDGSLLIGHNQTLQKWDPSKEGGVKTWNRQVNALLQLRDGRIVIGSPGTLEVWSSDMEECLSTWNGYNRGFLLQLESGVLVDTSREGLGWNVKTGQLIYPSVDIEWIKYKKKIQDFENFCELTWDQDRYKILDLSQESDLRWALENEAQLQVGVELREGFLVYESFMVLKVLDPKANVFLQSFKTTELLVTACLLKDGSLAIVNQQIDPAQGERIIVWDPRTGKHLRVVDSPLDPSKPLVYLRSEPPEQQEPSSIEQCRFLEKVVPNEASSSMLKIWNSLPEAFKNFQFSPEEEDFPMIQLDDGSFVFSSYVFSSYERASIEIWNREANKRLEILGGGDLNGIFLLQDGSILTWIEKKPNIRIWNPVDGKMVQILRGHLDSVTCAIQLQEGAVVSGSEDNTLKVWELKGGNCLQTLQGHQKTVTSVLQLSEDRVLSGSEDGALKIWNLVTGECLKTIPCKRPVLSLFRLQDGRILSRSEKDKNSDFLQLWDLRKGVPIRSLTVQKGMFDQIRFQDEVLGREKIHLDIWHPFLLPPSFPDLFSSLSPFLNKLEEQVKEEVLKRELPLGTQYKCQWTKKLLQNPVRLKCGHIFEAVSFEKQECPLCKALIQGGVCIDLKLQETLVAAIKKYSVPQMTTAFVGEAPDKVLDLQSQARVHMEQKEFTKALDKYFDVLQFTKQSSAYLPIIQILKEHFPRQAPLAFLHLAKIQAKEEDIVGVQETLRSLSDLLKWPELFELLGECALLAKEPEEARAFYKQAVEQYESRDQKEDFIRVGEKLLAFDLDDASLYEKLLKLYEENEKKIALLCIGILAFRKSNPTRVKDLVEQAEKIDPGNSLFSLIYRYIDPCFRVV